MTVDAPALVLVGASAGGLPVLRRLLGDLPAGLPVAVLAVLHLPSRPRLPLVDLLRPASSWPVREVGDRRVPVAGEVLVPPPDRHLVLREGAVAVSDAPVENGCRPSLDVLFWSATSACADGVVAVVLSGALRDGAAGAACLERAGGRVLVQDPCDAALAGMPSSALAATKGPVVAPAAGLGAALRAVLGDVLRAGRNA